MSTFWCIASIYIIGMFLAGVAIRVNNNLYHRSISTEYIKDDQSVPIVFFWPIVFVLYIAVILCIIVNAIFSKVTLKISDKLTDVMQNVILVYRKIKEVK